MIRARGTELISPDDLMDSCKLLEGLHLGMRLRPFKSGVLVIQAGASRLNRLKEYMTSSSVIMESCTR
jgi:hypothetical protein